MTNFKNEFEELLTGGHPNSLGNTIPVVETVLANPERFPELFDCYFSEDEIVRLRVSNAMKRVFKENESLLEPYWDRFLNEISQIDQASTQWTLATLFERGKAYLNEDQKKQATEIMKRNVAEHNDWIVLNNTMETLTYWAEDNTALKQWLKPHLERHQKDTRKSVAKRATKFWERLYG